MVAVNVATSAGIDMNMLMHIVSLHAEMYNLHDYMQEIMRGACGILDITIFIAKRISARHRIQSPAGVYHGGLPMNIMVQMFSGLYQNKCLQNAVCHLLDLSLIHI